MDFDLQWLLLGLPIAFGLGWLASRLDFRQWRREQTDAPKAYFKGLNLLLNEQQDKAIDAFIEAVQRDPDTLDLHFALGNLFRRRGEYERAVRVHQHLLGRADLPQGERERAQHALAQDYMKAGLFDRAEEAFAALEGTPFETEARLALLTLHERSREWRAAVDIAHKLERSGTGSFASRIGHYWCELALEAEARDPSGPEAEEALRRAREAAPQAPRPPLLAGERAVRQADPASALAHWGGLMLTHPASFDLIAFDYVDAARQAGDVAGANERLRTLYLRSPTLGVLQAINRLDPDPARGHGRLLAHLQRAPTLSAAQALLDGEAAAHSADRAEATALHDAIARAAQPLRRYRCAACGFEAQHYFWQCPGCQSWDSYPPQRLEDL
ncbi:MAG: lipopolysaccharide assembly protein LapB [Burkholderiaceae bacterium]